VSISLTAEADLSAESEGDRDAIDLSAVCPPGSDLDNPCLGHRIALAGH
jgi:hypothetical protein